ncbi:MAG: hypothetical protein AAB624_03245 [Patescibacteria group bacterium]
MKMTDFTTSHMKKTLLVGLSVALLGAGAAFFIISSSDSPTAPDNLSQTTAQ